jgi:hypothetical protein
MGMVETRREGLDCIQVPQDMLRRCEHCNESTCSTKRGEFLDQLKDYQLLNKN